MKQERGSTYAIKCTQTGGLHASKQHEPEDTWLRSNTFFNNGSWSGINELAFVLQAYCVHFEVKTEFFNIITQSLHNMQERSTYTAAHTSIYPPGSIR
jgi:hypothetical protein